MSYTENHTPYHLDTTKFKKGLGSILDKRAFVAACREWHEINQLSRDVLFPARHPEVKIRLAKLNLSPEAEQARQVFDYCEESARRVLAAQLQELNRTRFEAATNDRVQALKEKLADVIEAEGHALRKREQAEAARYGVPFHESATLLSVEGTARDLRETNLQTWTGDPVEVLLGCWIESGGPIEVKS